jgi:hypothetical protein
VDINHQRLVITMKLRFFGRQSQNNDFETEALGVFATPCLCLACRSAGLNCGIRVQSVRVDPLSLLRKKLFSDFLESVVPECFYRESRRDRNLTPD